MAASDKRVDCVQCEHGKRKEKKLFIWIWLKQCKSYVNVLEGRNDRSNRSLMFFRLDALKKFEIFTGKLICWSLFSIKL